jgi:hypothetical protein
MNIYISKDIHYYYQIVFVSLQAFYLVRSRLTDSLRGIRSKKRAKIRASILKSHNYILNEIKRDLPSHIMNIKVVEYLGGHISIKSDLPSINIYVTLPQYKEIRRFYGGGQIEVIFKRADKIIGGIPNHISGSDINANILRNSVPLMECVEKIIDHLNASYRP